MKMRRLLVNKKLLMLVSVFLFAGYTQAQEVKETLTLTLDKALEIALSENPTIKVADEEIALKEVTYKETWQTLLPEVSLTGSWQHTIQAAVMKLNDMEFKMGKDGTSVNSDILVKICTALECTIDDIMEIIPD